MVAAVQRVAVGGNGLCLEGFVRPAHRHFGRYRADEIFPAGQLQHLPGGGILNQEPVRFTGVGSGDFRGGSSALR